ncbi:sensor histidine kinase [Bacillus sp. T33-2]|uniref:sensor histidine kinase n=1 Tax=Bacillus sp. T33-2 TaxID=2054168 RepID=UPI000C756B4B|nr:sensor histidine kinase [Bacillus sp. T33-2]PLR96761.1 sensor histidine kinase [Bacillus sp. T33-2]
MKFFPYLIDQKWLVFTYIVLMAFITLMLVFNPVLHVDMSSLLYIELMAAIIFFSYLCINYYQKRKFFDELLDMAAHDEHTIFPKPATNEESLYLQILKKQQQRQMFQIEKINEEKKEWLEYMTTWFHEIKTPISVSRMIYELDVGMDSLEEEMDKIEHFIEQALYFSRLSDFHKDYLIQEVDTGRVIREAVKLHTKAFLAKKIKLNLQIMSFPVLTDKKGLLFIVSQLLSNALKYTERDGNIDITIDTEKRTISVRDNGVGIDAEDLPRLFEKGFTGKNGRQQTASTGMGLYLVERMAQKLGHSISYTSQKGVYTEAFIHFPESEDHYYFRQHS